MESMLLLNAVSDLGVATLSFIIWHKLSKDSHKQLSRAFGVLGIIFLLLCCLNAFWSSGFIEQTEWDTLFVLPILNLAMLSVWFYVCLSVSKHNNIHYLIAFIIMGSNALLLSKNQALVSDALVAFTLLSLFFHVGIVSKSFARRISLVGIAYSVIFIAAALVSSLPGYGYVAAPWFIPNVILVLLLYNIYRRSDELHMHEQVRMKKDNFILEIVRLGLYVCGLSILLMLGILGVHELGHSLSAEFFGCSHETTYDFGNAKTHVQCEDSSASTILLLSGLVLTLLLSALMYIVGNDFARRVSSLMFAFSLIAASEDLSSLGVPDSSFIILILISSFLVIYGIVLIVRGYEQEYAHLEMSAA